MQVGVIRKSLANICLAAFAAAAFAFDAEAQNPTVNFDSTNLRLATDGTCTDASPRTSIWIYDVLITGVTADFNVNGTLRDSISFVLVDGQNRALDGQAGSFNVGVETNKTLPLNIATTPAEGPFHLLLIDGTNSQFYPIGTVVTDTPFATFTFDGGARDADCPTAPTDITAPLISSMELVGDPPTTSTAVTYRVTFNEPALNVSADDFELSGLPGLANITDVRSVSSSVFDVDISLSGANGNIRLQLMKLTDIADSIGNTGPDRYQAGPIFRFDDTPPRIASIVRQSPASGSTSEDSVTWRVVFDEHVSNVTTDDFEVSGTTGTVSSVNLNALVTDVTVTGGDMADLTGDITLSIADGHDIVDFYAGFAMTNTTPTGTDESTYSIDNTGPRIQSIERQSPMTERANATQVTWRFTFNEGVANVTVDDFSFSEVPGATPSINIVNDSVVDVTLQGGDLATYINTTVRVTGDGDNDITDLSGNPMTTTNVVGTNDNSFRIDRIDPSVSVRNVPPAIGSVSSFDFELIFTEDVSGLSIDDFLVTNGTVTGISGGPATYTVTVLPDGTGDISVSLNAGAVTDGTLVNSNAAENLVNVALDTTPPTINLFKAGAGSPFTTSPELTIAFSENVTGFTVDDIVVSGATLSGFRANNARFYFVTVDRIADGNFTVDIPAGVATDSVGLPNEAATQFQGAFDTVPPTAVLSTSATEPVVASSFIINIDFNEDVTGLSEGDFIVVNGSTNNLTGGPQNYTMEIRPTFGAAGNITIDMPAGGVEDAAEFENNPSNQLVVAFDRVAPTLTSVLRQSPSTQAIGAATTHVVFRATFSEDVTGVDVDDWAIRQGGGGSISSVSQVSARVYDITYALQSANGTIELGLSFGGDVTIEDIPGNRLVNDETTGTSETYERDTSAPIATGVMFTTAGGSPTASDTLMWTVSFNEDMTNASADDFALSGTTATITNINTPQADQVEVTASGGDLAGLNGTVTLGLSSSSDLSDLVGNPVASLLNSGTDQRIVTVDNTAPAPNIAAPTGPVSGPFVVAIEFTEVVTGFELADLMVSGGTASNLQTSDNASFNISITPDGDANITFDIAAGVATDLAGNDNTAATQAVTLYDLTPPTVTITSASTVPITGPFTVEIAFSEAVNGFEQSDVTVGNGTITSFRPPRGGSGKGDQTGTGQVPQLNIQTGYIVGITPGSGASVTVDVAADAAMDEAGNGNTAATQFSITHDPNRTLAVSLSGVGDGSVTSAPVGIDCGSTCSSEFIVGTAVTLTAAAEAGSSFASWTLGPCSGSTNAECALTLDADAEAAARFTLDNPPDGRIVAATLPGARSGYVGGPTLTAFLSVVSRASTPAQSCRVSAPGDAPFTLTYRALDEDGNAVNPANPLFDIEAGGTISFVLGMDPTVQTGANGYEYLPMVQCGNANLDPIVGVNSVLLNIGAAPVPDVLSIMATQSSDGVIRIPGPGRVGIATASAVNIGAGDGSAGPNQVTLTVSVDTGAVALPVELDVCQIDAITAACITPRGDSATTLMDQNVGAFFAVFARDTSTGGIPFDPANSRIFLRFFDGNGVLRSSTSAAITAPSPDELPTVASAMPTGRWSVLVRQPEGVWPPLARGDLFVMENGTAVLNNGHAVEQLAVTLVDGPQEGRSRFMVGNDAGVWMSGGAIRLGQPWAPEAGQFWGVRDMRGETSLSWQEFAGRFGENVILTEAGELRGRIGSCSIYAAVPMSAAEVVSVTLSGCVEAGEYIGLLNPPINDNEDSTLLIVNSERGWRLAR